MVQMRHTRQEEAPESGPAAALTSPRRSNKTQVGRSRVLESEARITVMPNPLAAHTYIFNVEFPSSETDTIEELLKQQPELFLERIRASLPTVRKGGRANSVDEVLGPFYRSADVAKWRARTRQQISAEATSHKLLRLTTDEGDLLFPAFQFLSDGTPVPGMKKVYDVLVPAVFANEWDVAHWLTGPIDSDAPDQARIDAMREGDADTILTIANQLKLRALDEAA
jgi:hypothetical protein